jgi:hypothetical protein
MRVGVGERRYGEESQVGGATGPDKTRHEVRGHTRARVHTERHTESPSHRRSPCCSRDFFLSCPVLWAEQKSAHVGWKVSDLDMRAPVFDRKVNELD